jgi:hypothetical protein
MAKFLTETRFLFRFWCFLLQSQSNSFKIDNDHCLNMNVMLPNLSFWRFRVGDRETKSLSSTIVLLMLLTSCANSPVGESLQRSLEADPQLKENNPDLVQPTTPTPAPTVALPQDFPFQIPLYPGAKLLAVEPEPQPGATETPSVPTPPKTGPTVSTRWQTDDRPEQVKTFWQSELQKNNWQLLGVSTDSQPDIQTNDRANKIIARQENLEVTFSIVQNPDAAASNPQSPTPLPTQYLISYHRLDSDGVATTPETTPETIASTAPQTAETTETAIATNATDIDQAPEPLRSYIQDLSKLGVLQMPVSKEINRQNAKVLEPNKVITRRQYAQWLMLANNKIYANQPSKQIRLATPNAQPAFQDVPTSDPDFPVIQGLAEAGIIPSSLAGETTTVTFSPDQPLTRQDLILWKVPLDSRRSLPTASVDAVKETWGFQDSSKIEPRALRAVLADHQNGDLANIRRAFGYTTLFQPQKTVTRAEAAAVLWYFGIQGEGRSAADALALSATQSTQPNQSTQPTQSTQPNQPNQPNQPTQPTQSTP